MRNVLQIACLFFSGGILFLIPVPAVSAACTLVYQDIDYTDPAAHGYYEYLSNVSIKAGDEIDIDLTLHENPVATMFIVHVVFYKLPISSESDSVHYHDIHMDRMADGTITRTFSPNGSDPFTESLQDDMTITISDILNDVPPGDYRFTLEIEAHFDVGGGAHLDAEISTSGDECAPAPGAVDETAQEMNTPVVMLCRADGLEIHPLSGEAEAFAVVISYEEIEAAAALKPTGNYFLQSSGNGQVQVYLLPSGTHLQVRMPEQDERNEHAFTFPLCNKP